jgi:predicted ATPase
MLKDVDPTHAPKLAKDVGEWPLALELAASMMRERVRNGEPKSRAAERISEIIRRKGAKSLEDPTAEPRHRTITAVLDVSLDLLSDEDRQRLAELSIFPEDIDIPLAVTATL